MNETQGSTSAGGDTGGADEYSRGVMAGTSVCVEDMSLVLDQDTRVLYLNPDGSLVFDQFPASQPVMLEPNTSYMLSSALQGNLLLGSQAIYSSASQQVKGSLAHSTVTMVIEGSTSLAPEYILVEPNPVHAHEPNPVPVHESNTIPVHGPETVPQKVIDSEASKQQPTVATQTLEDDIFKSNRRQLEQSHIEHQLKLLQEKSLDCLGAKSEKPPIVDLQSVTTDIDDTTPIFASISAQLNSALLQHVPGCHQFLLDLPGHLAFTDKTQCHFTGDLQALIALHNALKNILQLKNMLRLGGCDTSDQAVSCQLIKPYVSCHGRQPKCSSKVAQVGFVAALDLCADNGADDGRSTHRKRKDLSNRKKRGRPRKTVPTGSIKDNITVTSWDAPGGDGTHQSCHAPGDDGTHQSCDAPGDDVTHQSCHAPGDDGTHQPCDAPGDDGTHQSCDAPECLEGEATKVVGVNLPFTGTVLQKVNINCLKDKEQDRKVGRKRGRPCKQYDPSAPVEKVRARNPLTESAATKQQRNYEEHLAFKFFCSQCSFKSKRQSHFQSHLRCHRGGSEKKYCCHQCDFITLSLPMFKQHQLKHKLHLFRCDICAAYSTDRMPLLRKHLKLKHNQKSEKLTCHECAFTCQKPKDMSRHQALHNRPRQDVTCSECKKSFANKIHLHRHVRDVHGPEVRPHLCDTCGKTFKRTDALQQHKLVHLSRTARSFPFKCSACGKGFRSPAHLKEHMTMHSSERPYLCHFCGAAFKTQPVQRKHILTLHLQPRIHVCAVCCRQFNTKYTLQKHEHTHHKADHGTEVAILIEEDAKSTGEKCAVPATVIEGGLQQTFIQGPQDGPPVQQAYIDGPQDGPPVQQAYIDGSQDGQVLDQTYIDASQDGQPVQPAYIDASQDGQVLQQAYLQSSQDGTLYYFTGQLESV